MSIIDDDENDAASDSSSDSGEIQLAFVDSDGAGSGSGSDDDDDEPGDGAGAARYMPNKLGGAPVFLDSKRPPGAALTTCGECGKGMAMFAQVYAPFEGEPEAYHRAVYVLCCLTPTCHVRDFPRRGWRVLRCQLPEKNDCIEAPPGGADDDDAPTRPAQQPVTCAACGMPAASKCGRCGKVWYCSREHQRVDWSERHKGACGKGDAAALAPGPLPRLTFPELPLVVEEQDKTDDDGGDDGGDDGADCGGGPGAGAMVLSDKATPVLGGTPMPAGDGTGVRVKPDKAFARFLAKVEAGGRGQVLRYSALRGDGRRKEGARPVWVAEKGRPGEGEPHGPVPPCGLCGAERAFELQVQPQSIHMLGLDRRAAARGEHALDFGTVAVFSCSRNCPTRGYAEEVAWKQDVAETERL